MSKRRVVITGLGWATSLGNSVNDVFAKMVDGQSGIKMLERFDYSDYGARIGGEITDWSAPHLDPREAKRLDRFAQFAVNASIDAVNDSGIDFSKENPYRCGSIIGSGIGGMEEFTAGHQKLLEKGPSRVSPFMVPKLMCNAGCGNVSIHFGIKGPNYATTTACASAAHAIGEAADHIRHDSADVIVAGGSEAALCHLGVACFVAIKALSKRNDDPTRASRPWDKDRDGFVLSEGCGIVVLEEYEHAKARGAKIYAELLGFGQSADGTHITAPDPEGRGAAEAMSLALADAGKNPADLDYINAHGTSTGLGDAAETVAIKRTLGDAAYKVPVSSSKSMTGHTLGASGGLEAVICCKTLESGTITPTINLDEPDEGLDLDFVPNQARQADVSLAMSNSFGFGGHNVALVFGKV
ncbi:MAG: beta-ketoacyl-ACP synthase II [Planctomycetota bacterium]